MVRALGADINKPLGDRALAFRRARWINAGSTSGKIVTQIAVHLLVGWTKGFLSSNRSRTFFVNWAISLSYPFQAIAPARAIDPVENTAPRLSVSEKVKSARMISAWVPFQSGVGSSRSSGVIR